MSAALQHPPVDPALRPEARLSPRPDGAALLARAEEMIAAGRAGAGRPLLAALDRIGGYDAAVADLRARLALHEERPGEAVAGLDAAIVAFPADAALRRRRAEALGRLQRYGEAARDAAEAVILDPADPVSRAMLGGAMLLLGRLPEACACLEDAVARSPAEPVFRQALADAQERSGAADLAERTLVEGIALAPGAALLRTRLALLHACREDWPSVIETAEAARRAGAAEATLFRLQGHALAALRRDAEAGEAFTEALKLAPNDSCLRHLAAAAGAVPAADSAPAAYVRAMFDVCAGQYEACALAVGHRTPGLIRAAVEADLPLPPGPVLDLGCGTGLVGVAVHDLGFGWTVGVDVSPGMAVQAASHGVYDEMHAVEIVDFLSAETRRFALVLAGDVLCYFGALGPVLALVRGRLMEGGLFVLSVETDASGAPDGWKLLPTGRYAHSARHVLEEAAWAGLEVLAIAHEVLRHEHDGPVAGLLVTLARLQDAG